MSKNIIGNKQKILSIINTKAIKNNRSMFNNDRANNDNLKKTVFISQSNNIYKNLALVDWLYRYSNFTNNHILLLWKNNLSIEIGKNNNPWLDANCQTYDDNEMNIVRRNTDGKTVYHNNENLNMSFFTPNTCYDKHNNIEIISNALYKKFGIYYDDNVNSGNFNILCSALKIGQANAYHHCSIRVNNDNINQGSTFEKNKNNTTKSTASPLSNLYDVDRNINRDILVSAIGWEYLRTSSIKPENGGTMLTQKQQGFQMINPSEDWFPGLETLEKKYKSWQWNYGKTPKFTITRLLKFPVDSKNTSWFHSLKLSLEVENGIVVEIKLSLPPNFVSNDKNQDASVITNLRGSKYGREITDKIVRALGCTSVPQDVIQTADKSNVAATQ